MIDPTNFASNMLLSSNPATLALALGVESNALRKIYASVEAIDWPAQNAEMQLASDTSDVLLVAFNRILLFRTAEDKLDMLQSDWRNASDPTPRAYIWRSEEALQLLRLFPTPSIDAQVHVVKLSQPQAGVALWHNALVALRVTSHAARAVTLHGRPELLEALDILTGIIYDAHRFSSIRS